MPVKIYKKGLYILWKDTKRYHKSLAKSSKGVFTIANASIYSNSARYSGAVKTCKKFVSPINR